MEDFEDVNDIKMWFLDKVEENLRKEYGDKEALDGKMYLLLEREKELNIAEKIANDRLKDEIEYLTNLAKSFLERRRKMKELQETVS